MFLPRLMLQWSTNSIAPSPPSSFSLLLSVCQPPSLSHLNISIIPCSRETDEGAGQAANVCICPPPHQRLLPKPSIILRSLKCKRVLLSVTCHFLPPHHKHSLNCSFFQPCNEHILETSDAIYCKFLPHLSLKAFNYTVHS